MTMGNGIIITSEPKGTFVEGIIDGTPKPGTVMQLKAGVEPVGGRFTYQVYDVAADGVRKQMLVLLPDLFQGRLATDAYASGERGFLYVPVAGEELNMLVANISGTGDSFAIGATLMVDDGTGKLIATTGSPQSEPFQVIETTAALTADTLVACVFTGY